MGWRKVKVEDQREYLVKSYISKIASMQELCDECGVSRKTGYKWYQRFQEEGTMGLVDKSRIPKSPKKKFSDAVITTVLELKNKYPKYGPKKILAILNRSFPERNWPCATRLYEIFKDHHLVSSRKLKRRVARTHPLGEINASNDLWCIDFKGWFRTQDGNKVEPLTVTDAFSRFVVRCLHMERKHSEDVWNVLTRAFYDYGLPLRMRSDNGPPFATVGVGRLSLLSVRLIQVGITPEWINPGHPEENGRHERFHRSLKDAVANPPASNFIEQVQRMHAYVDEYNFERPHEALDQQVPGSVYQPSNRQWDGKLHSPEYKEGLIIRKVCVNGCVYWKRKAHYLGELLKGEYVALEEVDNDCFHVKYGPILLGTIIRGEKFEIPRRKCYPCR